MKGLSILAALSAALLPATPAFAGDCDGTPGFVLDVPTHAPIGSTVDVHMQGPANEMAFFMLSLGEGPLDSPYGTICLDFPLVLGFIVTLDGEGHFAFSGDIPCDPALVDFTVFMQFLTCRPNKGVSNQASLTFTDAICDGDLCTFTQGGWGSSCSGSNPGCRRDEFFDSVFPHGVTIGDPDGVDGDSDFALHFHTSADVEAFLPAGGTPGLLDGDANNPTSSSAGVFAGELLAARLNVAFDDAGALDDCKGRTELALGDLVLIGGVDSDLLGFSVRELIELADAVISGALGAGPFDLDGDTVPDVTVSDISDALDVVNNNFVDGTTNNGNLGLP